jgi:hypothetical protein
MMSICENGAFMLSNHAAARMAQRGIRGACLDLVLLHGTPVKAKNDCEEYVLSGRTAQHLEAAGYDDQTVVGATKLRAIVDTEGTVVTCYHRRNGRSRPSFRKSHLRGEKRT